MSKIQIVLGKEGNQKFPILNAGVSRRHALLTIENNRWILEDLNSTNGTYISENGGPFRRISKVEITEDTCIRLGDGSINGYAFTAHHAIEEDPNNYSYEFEKLRRLRDDLAARKAKAQNMRKNSSLVNLIVAIAILGVTFLPHISSQVRIIILRLGLLIPVLFTFIIQRNDQLQKIQDEQRRRVICPRCGHPLSDFEVDRESCSSCKAHS